MRFNTFGLVFSGALAVAMLAGVGCDGGATTTNNGGGGSGAGATGGGGSGTGASSNNPCDPQNLADCPAKGIASDCVAIVDNSGKDTFGLRMSQIKISTPAKLAGGLVGPLVEDAVIMDLEACNLTGGGSFSLLMEFDKGAGTLKTGGAKPVTDPTAGYCFTNEDINGTPVAPITVDATIGGDGTFSVAEGQKVVVPIYISETTIVLLPLNAAKIIDATLSADQNCIGSYNLDAATPDNNCTPDPLFTAGAALDGNITLEDADSITISQLNSTLCAYLTGEDDGGTPAKCPRDGNGVITSQGDWCAATDMAGGCMDAFKLKAEIAASAVSITGDCP